MYITHALCIYFTKDVKNFGYFSKTKGVHEQNNGKRWSDVCNECKNIEFLYYYTFSSHL